MHDKCCDMSFGLNAPALAVGQLLAARDPAFAVYENGRYHVHIETKPWYNGRERGLCFVCALDYGTAAVHLAVYECRNSDSIMVEEWTDFAPWNEVSLGQRTEALGEEASDAVFANRKGFRVGQIGKVADYVYARMERYYKAAQKAAAKAAKEREAS